jgi:hypothetical protein
MALAMHVLLCAIAAATGDGGSSGIARQPDRPIADRTEAPSDDPQADIVVMGRRGAADMPPETELDAPEIDALGAYDIGEVIRRTRQTLGIDGEPVLIVNGRRVADSSIYLGFPPDALARIEVLPRDAGAHYAADPAQRVINIVLQPRFSSRDGLMAGWSLQGSVSAQISATRQSGLIDAESRQRTVAATLSTNRRLVTLPAGPVILNLSSQASSSTTRATPDGHALTGHSAEFNGTLSVPLWRAGRGTASPIGRALGDASVTIAGNIRQSGGNRGTGLTKGVMWTPLRKLRLNATWSTATDGISESQRLQATYYGLPFTIFDFARGVSAEVLPILGGTADLRAPRLRRTVLAAAIGPFTTWRVSGGISFQQSSAVDGIGTLAFVTPQIEAVFPERFQRDSTGRLTAIDERPLNFTAVRTATLASNLNMVLPLGDANPGGSRGTVRVALNGSWQLRSRSILHEGLPEMNLLAGDGGGLPRGQIDVQVDAQDGAWSAHLGARRSSGYRIRREIGLDGPTDLILDARCTITARVGYAVRRSVSGGALESMRRGLGTQIELELANLSDTRPAARLGTGAPAPGYGRNDQDPLGRTLRLVIKQRF